jgi:hypothetical protein
MGMVGHGLDLDDGRAAFDAHLADDLFEAGSDSFVDDLLVVLGVSPGMVGAPVPTLLFDLTSSPRKPYGRMAYSWGCG